MPQSIIQNGRVQLRAYSVSELAGLYDVCSRTFKKWLEPCEAEIGPKHGRFYTVRQVKIILEILGLPAEIAPES